ncbi:MAG: mechanosensitive ion channel [Deltaproteobacteria bacterium]|nr:mechanosensitive ion channel [Deltaproteobacteria bacterium]
MNRRSSKYSHAAQIVLILLILLADFFILPSHSLAQEKHLVWNDMITRERTEVKELKHELDKFIAEQPVEAKKVQAKIMELNRELRRLLLVHGLSYNTPIECRDTLKKMEALKKSVHSGINPIKQQIKDLDLLEKEIRGRKEEYSKLAEDESLSASAPIIREYVNDLDKVLISATKVKQLLIFFPNTVEDFLSRLEQRRSVVEKKLADLWETYFFKPTPFNYFTSEAWKWVPIVTANWWKYVPLFGLTPTEEQKSAYHDFVLQIIISWLAASIVGYLFLRWLGKKLPDSHSVRYFLPSFIWTALGVSVLINTVISEHFQFGTYQSFADIFISGGAVSFAWNLRKDRSPEEGQRTFHNILWPLWLIYATGIIVQILCMHPIVATPVFTTLFLLSSLYYYLLEKRITHGRDQKLSTLTAALSAILVVAALLGWGSLAMILSAFWFMIILNIELGSGLSGYFWKVIHSGRHKSHVLILFSNMALPLVFIGLLTLMVVWAAIYMGGMPLLQKIIQWEIDWGMIRLRITTVLTLAALFFMTRSFIALFHTAIKFQRKRWENIEEGAVKSLQTLSSYVIWSVYIIVSLHFLGVGIGNLAIIAGGLSVGVGFALQDLLKNFVSGLMLLFGRSIHPGDEIQIEDVHGSVKRINIRSTVVQTNEDSTIFLPNSDLVSKKVVNWTHKDPRGRTEVIVGVAYGTDTDLVKDLLVKCALANPDVLKTPPPYVLFNDFGDNALILHLRFWIMHVVLARDKVKSAIRFEIDRVFKEHNIELAYPQRDIHIRSVDGLSGYLNISDGPVTKVEQ